MNVRFAAFVDTFDMFDKDLFGLSSVEANGLDPQGRMLLENTLNVIKDGKWRLQSKNNIGV
jgi:acyl transferase domain-containing protein